MTTPEPRRPTSPPPRRFNLGDIAILVVALAIFFALARYTWEHQLPAGWTFVTPNTIAGTFDGAPDPYVWLEIIGTGLVVVSFTLVVLRLRRPRPRLRPLMRQPGFLAALAASIGSGVAFGNESIQQALLMLQASTWPPALAGSSLPLYRFSAASDGTMLAGFVAVLSAWLILRWDHRWRSERSWLDRAGRLLGWSWLVLLPLWQLLIRLMPFLV